MTKCLYHGVRGAEWQYGKNGSMAVDEIKAVDGSR